jgi:hypothetical protein
MMAKILASRIFLADDFPKAHAVIYEGEGELAWKQEANGLPGCVEWKVYEIDSLSMDDKPNYWIPDAGSNAETTEQLEEADWWAEGSVDWQGCVNWSHNTEEVRHHACSASELTAFFGAIQWAYARACELVGATADA